MELIRYARIAFALYTIIMAGLLWKQRRHGIEIVIGFYGLNVLLFYANYFFKAIPISNTQLNTWSALLGLHATLVFAFYCTEKLILLSGLKRAQTGLEE